MEFEISFTDLTMIEADGAYKEVCSLMEIEAEKSKIKSKNNNWMIRSKIVIVNPLGSSTLICHFYNDGRVFVADFFPSSKDIHNVDIRCLSFWCSEKGWKKPSPLPAVADYWLPFWKKEWETFIVDSEYLEKKFGERREIESDNSSQDSDEDEDSIDDMD